MTVHRNQKGLIIDCTNTFKVISNDGINIKQGQLNQYNQLHGLGRKITLRPIFNGKCKEINFIKGFKEELTYFEEGNFIYDEMNFSFGRRILMNGFSQLGWFQNNGERLHGYGRKSSNNLTGLFESGIFKGTDDDDISINFEHRIQPFICDLQLNVELGMWYLTGI